MLSETPSGSAERHLETAPKLIMLVNPTSGKGRGRAVANAAAARLRELGAEVSVRAGSSSAHSRELAAAALQEHPAALVVVGGDGTLATVLDELVHSRVPVVIVPAGTGNDFARALGVPFGNLTAAAQAAEIALTGEVREIDVALVHCPERSTHVLTVAALGFDARVSERTNRLRWPRGAARYYLALVIELLRLRAIPFSISRDGEEVIHRPGILVAVGNTRSYGGGMPICPEADPSDGKLDLTHVAAIGRLKLLRFFPLMLAGRHAERPEVLTAQCARVELSAPGLIVYADGERIGTESVRIEAVRGALAVMAAKE